MPDSVKPATRPALGALDTGVMPPTRTAAVAAHLRRMITSGELAPGTPLRQNEMAELLKVSSTPVREAFLLLAREGLVEHDAHRGVVVFQPSANDVRENFEIRAALESLAMELATSNITEGELKELDSLLEKMRTSLRVDKEYHTRVLNPQFHGLIYATTGRPKLISLINSLRDTAVVYHSLLSEPSASDEYLVHVQMEHEEIVAALRARSPERGVRAIRVHINNNCHQTMSSLRCPPGWDVEIL